MASEIHVDARIATGFTNCAYFTTTSTTPTCSFRGEIPNNKVLYVLVPLNNDVIPGLRKIQELIGTACPAQELSPQGRYGKRDIAEQNIIGESPYSVGTSAGEVPVPRQAKPIILIAAHPLGICSRSTISGLQARGIINLDFDEVRLTHLSANQRNTTLR